MATTAFPLRIGDLTPDFTAPASVVGTIHWHDYINGHWAILFSHPADFTPVCTTELGTVAKMIPEFEKRGVKVAGLSVDPIDKHEKWIEDINETQKTKVNYPIIGDVDRSISVRFGMLDQTELDNLTGLPLTVRSVFIVDSSKKIRLILTYPASCGRNFDEILRVVDSLQLTDRAKVTTPANWKKGDDVIVAPSVNNEDAKKLFGDFTTHRPYLRTVKWEQVKDK